MGLLPPVLIELKANAAEFSSKLGEAHKDLDDLAKKSATTGEKIQAGIGKGAMAVGGTLTGVGVLLGKEAAEGQQSQALLQQAIKNSGGSFDEYEKRIDSAAQRMAHFGKTDNETQEALTTLINATHSTSKSLDQMQLVADLAASKHIGLSEAAALVAKVDVGKGAKALAMYGISSKDAADAGKLLSKANKEVEATAAGQAGAEEKLSDLKERLSGKTKLTIADQQALRHASEDLYAATVKHNEAVEKAARAQKQVAAESAGGKDSIELLTKAVHGNADVLSGTWQGRMDEAKARLSNLAEEVGQKVGPAFVTIGPLMTAAGGAMQSNLLPNIAKAVSSTVGWAASTAASAATAAASWIASMAAMAASAIASAAAMILPFLPVILIVAAIGAAVYLLWRNWDTVWGWIKDAASAAGAAIGAAFEWIKGVIAGAINWIGDHLPLIAAILTGPFGLAVLFIHEHFDAIVGFVQSMPGRIERVASGMWDGILHAFKSAINLILRGWNALEFRVPGFDAGPLHFGGFTLGVPDIPLLAAGGIARRPTLGIFGEAGPEAIVPLNRAGEFGFGGGGGDLVLQVDGQTLARIAWAQLLRMKNQGGQTSLGLA